MSPQDGTSAAAARIRQARIPALKSLEEFGYEHRRSLERATMAHLGAPDFIAARENAVFPGPPGTGSPSSPPRPNGPTGRPGPTRPAGWRRSRSGSIPLPVVDEVGHVPVEPEAADLFFQPVSNRSERASLIVTSNKPFD